MRRWTATNSRYKLKIDGGVPACVDHGATFRALKAAAFSSRCGLNRSSIALITLPFPLLTRPILHTLPALPFRLPA